MTTVTAPICVGCEYFRRDAEDLSCDAFPGGIPDGIIRSEVDHRQPVPGDGGIRFEPRTPDDARHAVELFGAAAEPSALAYRRAVLERAYSPGQKRDSIGRFGSGGGTTSGGAAFDDTGQLAAPNDMSDFSPEAQAKFMQRAKELGEGFPQTPEAMAAELLKTYDRATPDQRAKGMVWYQDAHDAMAARATGDITPDMSFGVLAVCSPRTRWEKNLQQAEAILKVHREQKPFEVDAETYAAMKDKKGLHGPGTYTPAEMSGSQLSFANAELKAVRNQPFGDNCDKAFRILRGESPDTVIGGPKVRNFYNNIRRPDDPRSVTVDTWQVRAQVRPGVRLPVAHYEKGADGKPVRIDHTMSEDASTQTYFDKPAGLKVGIETRTGMYPYFGTALQIAASQRGILPQQMQAITWTVVKESTEGRTSTGGGGAEE